MRALIIDDEPHCINALQRDLQLFCPEVAVVATCNSGKEGIQAILKHTPELVFLDISMPLMSGFEMLEQLGTSANFTVIFTTAYDQFMLKALRVSAFDYLLKPVDPEQLITTLNRLKSEQAAGGFAARVQNHNLNKGQAAEKQRIAFRNKDGYDFVRVDHILYCNADGAYTDVILLDGRKLVVSRSLGEIAPYLPDSLFERIHHSTIINLSEVVQFSRSEGLFVTMENGDRLTVARSRKEHLLIRLGIA
jgi:two-component system, LytTR family, response regulator